MQTQEQRDVFNAAYRIGVALGRKFETSDLTPELRQAARLYAASYDGDFDFMVQMRDNATTGYLYFTDGQSKSILNCLMADAKRRMAAKPKAQVASPVAVSAPRHMYLETVPDGRYRVTLPDGDHLAILVRKAGQDSKLAGSRVVSTRTGGDEWTGQAHITSDGEFRQWRSSTGQLRTRVAAAVNVLDQAKSQDEWLVAGLAFAQEGSQCFICGRDLDTPESLTAGYGPVCADKHGLPWGAKAIPMSVRLAQAAAPTTDPITGVEESVDELLDLVAATAPVQPAAPSAAHYSNHRTAQVSLAEAKARGYQRTYEEIFGEDDY